MIAEGIEMTLYSPDGWDWNGAAVAGNGLATDGAVPTTGAEIDNVCACYHQVHYENFPTAVQRECGANPVNTCNPKQLVHNAIHFLSAPRFEDDAATSQFSGMAQTVDSTNVMACLAAVSPYCASQDTFVGELTSAEDLY